MINGFSFILIFFSIVIPFGKLWYLPRLTLIHAQQLADYIYNQQL